MDAFGGLATSALHAVPTHPLKLFVRGNWMISRANSLVRLFFAIFLLLLSQAAYSDAKSDASDDRLPKVLNTNHQCVVLAREVLEQNEMEGMKSIPELIKCLEGDYYYFDKGAARVALAHIGQPAVPLLIKTLDDPNSSISEGAAIALGMIGPKAKAAVPALKDILAQQPKPGGSRQREAAKALGKIGEIGFLIRALEGKEANIQPYLASHGLAAAGPAASSAVPALMEALNSSDSFAQMYAADALGAIGPAANSAVPRLRELSKSSLNFVRRSAGEALIKIGTPEAKEAAKPYERRKYLVNGFFRIMSVFVAMPLLAVVVGLFLGVMAYAAVPSGAKRKFLTGTLYIPALYAGWEYYCQVKRYDIRIDLLLIYPILALATVLGLALWVIGLTRFKSDSERRKPGSDHSCS